MSDVAPYARVSLAEVSLAEIPIDSLLVEAMVHPPHLQECIHDF